MKPGWASLSPKTTKMRCHSLPLHGNASGGHHHHHLQVWHHHQNHSRALRGLGKKSRLLLPSRRLPTLLDRRPPPRRNIPYQRLDHHHTKSPTSTSPTSTQKRQLKQNHHNHHVPVNPLRTRRHRRLKSESQMRVGARTARTTLANSFEKKFKNRKIKIYLV